MATAGRRGFSGGAAERLGLKDEERSIGADPSVFVQKHIGCRGPEIQQLVDPSNWLESIVMNACIISLYYYMMTRPLGFKWILGSEPPMIYIILFSQSPNLNSGMRS